MTSGADERPSEGLETGAGTGALPLPLTWVDHPARQAPGRLAITTFVLLIAALALVLIERSVPLALAGLAVLLGAIAPFLLPTRYTLSAQGVSMQSRLSRKHRSWEELRRWQEDRNGILVSPFRQPSWLDDLRSIYLRGGPKAQIRQILQARLGDKAPLPGQ